MYPKAIVHVDGDAFFASIEQAKNWRLRGKPVVTGAERGAATSISYEAKALGIHRGVPMRDIRERFPEVAIVPSDYTSYSLFAGRMYRIVGRYAKAVEEYSIDECFADITGLDEVHGCSYGDIARTIKKDLEESLGITFGVGLAPTKTLAKLASKKNKPAGFTEIPPSGISDFLREVPIHSVWGLGGVTGSRLHNCGVSTAYAYTQQEDAWLKEHGFVKPQRDTWLELKGHAVLALGSGRVYPYSVMKTRTFTPPSMERARVFAELSKNVEAACAKVRRKQMRARAMSFYLKTQEFTYHGQQVDLVLPTALPSAILEEIVPRFDRVFAEGVLYRASGITLRNLIPESSCEKDLFGEVLQNERRARVFSALDAINKRYGKESVFLGATLPAIRAREKPVEKKVHRRFDREYRRKRINIPYLGTAK